MHSINDQENSNLLISEEKIDRRSFLQKTALTISGVGFLGTMPIFAKSCELTEYPFTMGVASGEPLQDGIVLWTRLAPKPLAGGGMPDQTFPVNWEIASDSEFLQIVQKGTELATKDLGHSVHVEVGNLQSGQNYWYRFKSGNFESPTGKTKTAPNAGTDLQEMKFAIASCQNYASGYYTAYDHMVNEDLDVILFLGDYIYEKGSGANALRKHLPDKEIMTLEDYRIRYGQYKSDPSLMAAHAAFPWIVVPDDHEVKNNWGGAGPPYDNNAAFLQRRGVAFQAYYEHMPLRKSSLPKGFFMDIYRKFQFGNLVELSMLDTRQFRTDFACSGNSEVDCAMRFGADQEKWLADNLTKSKDTWNFLGQQVGMAQVGRKIDGVVSYGMDKWDGYAATRARLFDTIQKNKVKNFIVLTGDSHKNWVNDLHLDADDPSSPIIGTEFMGTSISSAGDGQADPPIGKELIEFNPHIKFYNEQRGYVCFTVPPTEIISEVKVIPYVTRPNAEINTIAKFKVKNGVSGVTKV